MHDTDERLCIEVSPPVNGAPPPQWRQRWFTRHGRWFTLLICVKQQLLLTLHNLSTSVCLILRLFAGTSVVYCCLTDAIWILGGRVVRMSSSQPWGNGSESLTSHSLLHTHAHTHTHTHASNLLECFHLCPLFSGSFHKHLSQFQRVSINIGPVSLSLWFTS